MWLLALASVVRCTGMNEPPQLYGNAHWRMAVWSLRAGYTGLALAAVGVILTLTGSTPWVLAGGVIIWLSTVAVTLTGFVWARHELSDPRPTVWSMRLMLIHDSLSLIHI